MPADPAVADANVLAPIVVEVVVAVPPARAFDYFTRDIARWWPLRTHSVGEADAVGVRFEGRAGGRLIESLRDGSECVWGTIEAWEPGARLRFSWHPGRDASTAQTVDVTFVAQAGGTRVTLTHDGWERRGDDAAKARDNYVGGWKLVLGERFGGYCDAADR